MRMEIIILVFAHFHFTVRFEREGMSGSVVVRSHRYDINCCCNRGANGFSVTLFFMKMVWMKYLVDHHSHSRRRRPQWEDEDNQVQIVLVRQNARSFFRSSKVKRMEASPQHFYIVFLLSLHFSQYFHIHFFSSFIVVLNSLWGFCVCVSFFRCAFVIYRLKRHCLWVQCSMYVLISHYF